MWWQLPLLMRHSLMSEYMYGKKFKKMHLHVEENQYFCDQYPVLQEQFGIFWQVTETYQ